MGDRPIDVHSLYRQVAYNAVLAGAGGKATADFIVIDVLLPAFVNAFGARRFDPGALTILDELQLHIGDHAEYGDDHSPHVARRRHLWPQDAQRSSLFLKLMQQVPAIARVADRPGEP